MRAAPVKSFYPIQLGSRIVYLEKFKGRIIKNASNSKSGQEITVLEKKKTDVSVDFHLIQNLCFSNMS